MPDRATGARLPRRRRRRVDEDAVGQDHLGGRRSLERARMDAVVIDVVAPSTTSRVECSWISARVDSPRQRSAVVHDDEPVAELLHSSM